MPWQQQCWRDGIQSLLHYNFCCTLIACNWDIGSLEILVTAQRSSYIGLLPTVLQLGLALFMICVSEGRTHIWGQLLATRISARWGGCKIYQKAVWRLVIVIEQWLFGSWCVILCFMTGIIVVESSWNVTAHGDAGRGSEGETGKWSG